MAVSDERGFEMRLLFAIVGDPGRSLHGDIILSTNHGI